VDKWCIKLLYYIEFTVICSVSHHGKFLDSFNFGPYLHNVTFIYIKVKCNVIKSLESMSSYRISTWQNTTGKTDPFFLNYLQVIWSLVNLLYANPDLYGSKLQKIDKFCSCLRAVTCIDKIMNTDFTLFRLKLHIWRKTLIAITEKC